MEGVALGMEGYLIKVQGGVIAEGTDGGQLHQPIILPCSNWFIILQTGSKVGRKAGEKWWRTEREMQTAQRSRQVLGRREDGDELGRWGGREQVGKEGSEKEGGTSRRSQVREVGYTHGTGETPG